MPRTAKKPRKSPRSEPMWAGRRITKVNHKVIPYGLVHPGPTGCQDTDMAVAALCHLPSVDHYWRTDEWVEHGFRVDKRPTDVFVHDDELALYFRPYLALAHATRSEHPAYGTANTWAHNRAKGAVATRRNNYRRLRRTAFLERLEAAIRADEDSAAGERRGSDAGAVPA